MPTSTNLFYKISTAICALTIAFLSLLPQDQAISSGTSDKIDHFLGYSILSFLFIRAFPKHPILIFVICSFYGIIIEVVQGHIGRFPEVLDAVANSSGAAFGIMFSIFMYRLRNK